MSESPVPFDETNRQSAEIAVVERLLEYSSGSSSLSIAVCNSSALRDSIIAKLRKHFEIEVVSLPAGTDDPFDYVCKTLGSSRPPALFITNMEASVPSTEERQPALHATNAARELWRERFGCPIVFWIPEYVVTLFAFHAPDLWSWLSHRFEFVSQFAHPMEAARGLYYEPSSMAGNLDAEKKRFRIAELEQRIEEAEVLEKKELAPHLGLWNLELGILLHLLGESHDSEKIFRKIIFAPNMFEEITVAAACNNLGLVFQSREDYDNAESMHKQALEIEKRIGREDGMASGYSNLGMLYIQRGELKKAKEMIEKALEISERLRSKENMAINYGNLGLVYLNSGDLKKAEEMLNKTLELSKSIENLGSMAAHYGNLGLIYRLQGDLTRAKELFENALEINRRLGRKEGMAVQYGNLGSIYRNLGEKDTAKQMGKEARDLYREIGILNKADIVQRWLDAEDSK